MSDRYDPYEMRREAERLERAEDDEAQMRHELSMEQDAEQCDECEEWIPANQASMVNHYHKYSCSLHPDNVDEYYEPQSNFLGEQ